jgi:hypothetical protein
MTLVYYCEVEQENKDSGMLKGTYPENPDLWIHPEVPPAFFFVSLGVMSRRALPCQQQPHSTLLLSAFVPLY